MTNRILIIGLDGASPHLVRQWQPHLPHLSRLMKNGVQGTLWSILPPRSIPAWYCFATGMNPAKIGVFGFSQRLPEQYDYTFANLTYCRAPAFWQLLNQYGVKTAVLHVPGTFPPHPVDGALVSGWPAPANRGNLTYTSPPQLSRQLDAFLNQPFAFLSDKPMLADNNDEMLRERIRFLRLHGDVAQHVLTTTEWQVGLVVLSPLDRASHQFWRHMDTDHPAHDPVLADRFGGALKQVYQAADEQVGRLLETVTADDTVFIISDHGFGPAHRVFYLNEWLRQQGYLVLAEEKSTVSWRTRLIGRLSTPLFWLNRNSPSFRRLISPLKKRTLSNLVRDEYVRAARQGVVRLNHLPVDWSQTRVYCPDEGSLYLNLRGRDPQGIVTPGTEAETLLTEITARLQKIPDPTTHQSVPVTLHFKEDIYSGPFLAEAPDLLVVMDNYRTEVMAEMGNETLFAQAVARNGTHTLDGLFIAYGAGIEVDSQHDASLLDIAPTVLHLAGVPIPEEADGRFLRDIFIPKAEPRQRPLQTRRLGLDNYAKDEGAELTPQEQAQIEKQLRDLGYIN